MLARDPVTNGNTTYFGLASPRAMELDPRPAAISAVSEPELSSAAAQRAGESGSGNLAGGSSRSGLLSRLPDPYENVPISANELRQNQAALNLVHR
jgi:hypothetical protein